MAIFVCPWIVMALRWTSGQRESSPISCCVVSHHFEGELSSGVTPITIMLVGVTAGSFVTTVISFHSFNVVTGAVMIKKCSLIRY